jgi:hypothetical protein
VICYDYNITDKLSARSFEARIVGYTLIHEIYQVIDKNRKQRVLKDPKPINFINTDHNDPEDYAGSEDEIANINIKPEGNNPPSETILSDSPTLPPLPEKQKHHRKTTEEFTALYGSRQSTRKKQPSSKATSKAVEVDGDHPTDEQAHDRIYTTEWAYARQQERKQLRNYKVHSKITKEQIPDGTRIVDTKWVYTIKYKPHKTIEKFKVRKLGRGLTQEYGINYDKIYAQMMRPETWKMHLVIVLYRGWNIRQSDVVAAYLQAELDSQHKIYMVDINEKGETEY